jgi:hypothetical protein
VTEIGTELGVPDSALAKIPADTGVITVMRSDQPSAAQTAVKGVRVRSTGLVPAPALLPGRHPQANKGGVVKSSRRTTGSRRKAIATRGDMPNDVLMFAHFGLSIGVGQKRREVDRAARRETTSNDEDGFANAADRFVQRAS